MSPCTKSTEAGTTRRLLGGKLGAWGILCGNWGGQWHDGMLHNHIGFDLKSSAGTILLLQEATEELLQHLKQPGSNGIVKGGQETPVSYTHLRAHET